MLVAGPSRRFAASSPRLLRALNTQAGSSRQLAFAFDIDGVLKQGEHVLPQAKRVLKMLSGEGGASPIPYLMITNGGGVTEEHRRKLLSSNFGVEIGPDQLVQSHTPLQDYVGSYADKPVLVIGGQGEQGRLVAQSYGLKRAYIPQDVIAWNPAIWDRYTLSLEEEGFVKHVDFSQTPIEAVFVIHDHGMDWGLSIQIILEILSSQGGVLGTSRSRKWGESGIAEGEKEIPLILTNPDVIWGSLLMRGHSDYPLARLGMGAFRIALEAVFKETTGCELPYTQFGKPYTSTYSFAEKMLRRHLKSLGRPSDEPLSVYMVGDNPESDIAGANTHGWSSLLVKTGVFKGGKPSHTPTRIVEDVEEGVNWAIERERGRSSS